METGFHATTAGIGVDVSVFYLEAQSQPEYGRYVWAYRVKISNATLEVVQLISRTWRITDSHGHVMLVEGEGVVGKQPILEPGSSFEYTSGTHIADAIRLHDRDLSHAAPGYRRAVRCRPFRCSAWTARTRTTGSTEKPA